MSYNNKYMELTNMKMCVHKSLHVRDGAEISQQQKAWRRGGRSKILEATGRSLSAQEGTQCC